MMWFYPLISAILYAIAFGSVVGRRNAAKLRGLLRVRRDPGEKARCRHQHQPAFKGARGEYEKSARPAGLDRRARFFPMRVAPV